MPIYDWNPKTLSVHIPEMDAEHRLLVEKMNAVYDAGKSGAEKRVVSELLSDLSQYTSLHFKDEERLMEEINYPGAIRHKAIHQKLLDQMVGYQTFFDKTGILTDAFWDFLIHWWTTHIRTMDQDYAKHQENATRTLKANAIQAA